MRATTREKKNAGRSRTKCFLLSFIHIGRKPLCGGVLYVGRMFHTVCVFSLSLVLMPYATTYSRHEKHYTIANMHRYRYIEIEENQMEFFFAFVSRIEMLHLVWVAVVDITSMKNEIHLIHDSSFHHRQSNESVCNDFSE